MLSAASPEIEANQTSIWSVAADELATPMDLRQPLTKLMPCRGSLTPFPLARAKHFSFATDTSFLADDGRSLHSRCTCYPNALAVLATILSHRRIGGPCGAFGKIKVLRSGLTLYRRPERKDSSDNGK